jgi:RNA polymerase sigma-70 factor (ECF subfamily)
VQGASASSGDDARRRRRIVAAFLAASRDGNFDTLLALLDPDVVLRADETTVRAGAEAEVRGAQHVAGTFSGRARVARLALVDGLPGAVWAHDGVPRVVFTFAIADERIVGIELLGDAETLAALELATPDD